MPSHEWWSCKLTTFTPYSQLVTKQVLAKVVIVTFFESSKINYGVTLDEIECHLQLLYK